MKEKTALHRKASCHATNCTHLNIVMSACQRKNAMTPALNKAGPYRTNSSNGRLKPRPCQNHCQAKPCTTSPNSGNTLKTYTSTGRLELSNNLAERSIKPLVIGRKSWLFCCTVKGAEARSIIYLIIEAAKENGLKPFVYLKHIFETMLDIQPEGYAKLLPWNPSLPDSCHLKKDAGYTPDAGYRHRRHHLTGCRKYRSWILYITGTGRFDAFVLSIFFYKTKDKVQINTTPEQD